MFCRNPFQDSRRKSHRIRAREALDFRCLGLTAESAAPNPSLPKRLDNLMSAARQRYSTTPCRQQKLSKILSLQGSHRQVTVPILFLSPTWLPNAKLSQRPVAMGYAVSREIVL